MDREKILMQDQKAAKLKQELKIEIIGNCRSLGSDAKQSEFGSNEGISIWMDGILQDCDGVKIRSRGIAC